MFEWKIAVKRLIVILTTVFVAGQSPAAQVDECRNYPYLAELLCPSPDPAPFVALTTFKDAYDESVHNAGVEYFNANPELVKRIRDDLGSQEVRWRLEEISHRLVYAPEVREEVAGLFTNYCLEVIEDLLARTGLRNPYCSISTIVEETPVVLRDEGIKAFIVQDLAREYTARYQFSGPAQKRIQIDLSGRITINEVGSYSSYLHYSQETDNWEFIHDGHTIWKSVSSNLYTVLMTPLEETMHIALREHTEKAIMEAVARKEGIPSLKEVQRVVDDWMAVEEAIVGGLVYKLIPDVVIKRIPDLPMEWVLADLATKARFDKYHLLPKGIAVVENHGLKESIHLYSQDPSAFRALLVEPG
jgi:hypothetical protein